MDEMKTILSCDTCMCIRLRGHYWKHKQLTQSILSSILWSSPESNKKFSHEMVIIYVVT